MSMDMNKLLQQAQQMQAQVARIQEELKSETVEASAGGGAVTVKATGALEIVEVRFGPGATEDPEMLADMVVAATNEAIRAAESLAQQKLGPAMGGLSGLGLPGM
jgi:nucleoid-associated protein EbfC